MTEEPEPPTVTDVEIDSQPPFVHVVERHEHGREVLGAALVALIGGLITIVTFASPTRAVVLFLLAGLGGYLLGRWSMWPKAFGE